MTSLLSKEDKDKLYQKTKDLLKDPSSPKEKLEPLDRETIEDRKQDRELRRDYAQRWFWVVLGQLVLVNLMFAYLLILGNVDSTTLHIFFGATIAETFGIVAIITRSLFPTNKRQ